MKKIKIILLVAASIVLASCSSSDPGSNTSHPDHGKIALAADWSIMGEGIVKPTSYIIEIAGLKITATRDTYQIENLFNPGSYRGFAYNTAEHITVSNGIATVAGNVGGSSKVIEPQPGWFFASSAEVQIEKDTDHEFTAVMKQQVRQLNIELTVTEGNIDHIESIEATFSGIANSIDLKNGACSGAEMKTIPTFLASGNKLVASIRLIGLTTESQNLTLDLGYIDGSSQQIISDVSSELIDFATNKHLPLTLSANISISSGGGDGETETTFNSEISGWDSQGESSIEVEVQ